MRLTVLTIILLMPIFSIAQSVKSLDEQPDRVVITLEDGKLHLIPLSENAIRIQFGQDFSNLKRELILTSPVDTPDFDVSETSSELIISTSGMAVHVNKESGEISYANSSGKVF
ncbi:MAG: hypothetical protein WDZ47_01530, partial [Bacteroidales bacterium]